MQIKKDLQTIVCSHLHPSIKDFQAWADVGLVVTWSVHHPVAKRKSDSIQARVGDVHECFFCVMVRSVPLEELRHELLATSCMQSRAKRIFIW